MNGKAKVGDKLNRNDIPGNVTDMGDSDTKASTGYGRWVRSVVTPDYWTWVLTPEQREDFRKKNLQEFGVPASVISYGNLHVLAVEDEPDTDTDTVYRLPEIPDTAVALKGLTTGTRWERNSSNPGRWMSPNGGYHGFSLSYVLQREPDGVKAILKEPRHWPRLTLGGVTDLPAKVDVSGYGLWHRYGTTTHYARNGYANRTLDGLATMGDVTEVFE